MNKMFMLCAGYIVLFVEAILGVRDVPRKGGAMHPLCQGPCCNQQRHI